MVPFLKCHPSFASESFNGVKGETLVGFEVEDALRNEMLILSGKHRFATYKLVFLIETGSLRAQSYAEFYRGLGQCYRLVVISSGAHRIITQRLLRTVCRAASRTEGIR
jgi:hypothetical protein